MIQATLLLALATLAASSPLYERGTGGYPAANQKGPTPKPEWVATYNAAKAAGKIPGFAPASLVGGVPAYASGVRTDEKGVCSWSMAHCFGDDDIYEAPDGMYAIGFDDGPLPSSPRLYDFLQQNNQTASHFFIGSNILNNPSIFDQAVDMGGHIAVHTWSHPYMTTLTDMEVLGELGWTAQIIFDRSGRVPSWWRPPYGDADNRVRAIAQEVFGLTLVGWWLDTNDWCLSEGGGSSCGPSGPQSDVELRDELIGYQQMGKSPGIMALEHERIDRTVDAFIRTYPGIKQHGWDPRCVPDLFNEPWYANADRTEDPDESAQVGTGPFGPSSLPVSSTSSASSSAAASSSASAASDPTTAASSTAATTTIRTASFSSSSAASAASQLAPSSTPTSGASTSYTASTVLLLAASTLGLAFFA
ncbi:hypothetical protein JCM8547_009094 [Rhodosporidiobolus lusitaniae]